jgi:polysaccharide chain length determinant protein (PEP-CTERM system associated)
MTDVVKFYISIFLRRLPYFLLVAIVIGTVSVIVARSLPPVYVSSMRLIVESPRIPTELAASTVRTPAEERLQIIEQRLLTRANLLDVANRLDVFENQSEMLPDEIVEAMRTRTRIRSSTGRDAAALMTLSFEADTGVKAAGVLNEFLTMIQQEDVESRTGRAGQTLDFFEQEVARLSEELAKRSARVLAFKSENADALPESLDYRLNQQTLLQERLAQLAREVAGLDEQRDRLIQIFESTGQVAGMVGPAQTPEQRQLETLRSELNQALAVYSAENPRVKMLEARVAQLEKTVSAQPAPTEEATATSTGNSLLDVQLAEIATRRTILEEQRANTATQLEALNDTIKRTPPNAIQLDELQLDYANIQQQYNLAVDRLSQASTGERIEVMARGQRIAVIDPPAVPNKPTKPNRMMIAGGGGVFGILLGLGLVLLLEFLNRSIRRPEELVAKLGITPLATIPYIEMPGRRHRWGRTLLLIVVLVGVPAAIYAVHTYYQPLDLIAQRIMNKLGLSL